jgi:hypothetical protein
MTTIPPPTVDERQSKKARIESALDQQVQYGNTTQVETDLQLIMRDFNIACRQWTAAEIDAAIARLNQRIQNPIQGMNINFLTDQRDRFLLARAAIPQGANNIYLCLLQRVYAPTNDVNFVYDTKGPYLNIEAAQEAAREFNENITMKYSDTNYTVFRNWALNYINSQLQGGCAPLFTSTIPYVLNLQAIDYLGGFQNIEDYYRFLGYPEDVIERGIDAGDDPALQQEARRVIVDFQNQLNNPAQRGIFLTVVRPWTFRDFITPQFDQYVQEYAAATQTEPSYNDTLENLYMRRESVMLIDEINNAIADTLARIRRVTPIVSPEFTAVVYCGNPKLRIINAGMTFMLYYLGPDNTQRTAEYAQILQRLNQVLNPEFAGFVGFYVPEEQQPTPQQTIRRVQSTPQM